MIDAGPSLRAAEGLSGSLLTSYLLTRGWNAKPSRVEGISIISKDVAESDQPVELILPVVSGFSDEQRRVADALRSVAAVESRSVEAVAEDVEQIADAAKSSLTGMRYRPALGETLELQVATIEIWTDDIDRDQSRYEVVIYSIDGLRQVLSTPVLKFLRRTPPK